MRLLFFWTSGCAGGAFAVFGIFVGRIDRAAGNHGVLGGRTWAGCPACRAAYSYAAEKPPRMVDRAFLPEGLAQAPPKAAIVRRNRWMAQHADVVVTYLRRDTGGAYRAVCEARRWGKRIVPL